MELSIVIPAFNEAAKIARDIASAATFAKANNLATEIIVVDDGSTDQTAEVAENTRKELPGSISLQVIRYDRHCGKGHAVRTGITASKGKYVIFADAGSCVPYPDALVALQWLRDDICDIAHGSRRLAQSTILRPQSLYRRACATAFRCFLKLLFYLPAEITDSQCGFKLYRGDVARELYRRCTSDGFVFDVEIILRAVKQGYRIKEFPIHWTCDPDSRLSPSRNIFRVLSELFAIRKRLNR